MVEAAGIEPASGEAVPETSTCLSPVFLLPSHSQGQDCDGGCLHAFPPAPAGRMQEYPPLMTPYSRTGGNGSGRTWPLKLGSQCVVCVGSCFLLQVLRACSSSACSLWPNSPPSRPGRPRIIIIPYKTSKVKAIPLKIN